MVTLRILQHKTKQCHNLKKQMKRHILKGIALHFLIFSIDFAALETEHSTTPKLYFCIQKDHVLSQVNSSKLETTAENSSEL